MSIQVIGEHLFIVLLSALFSILLGLPLGIAAYRFPRLRALILKLVDILQTVPALALLGIIMVMTGAGKLTVIIGITLYSLLPIVRNTELGLEELDPGIKEAARGMGMSQAHRLFMVELPLAFPMIFTGIRIAVINAIGTAVFAAFVGGGGLGSLLNRGIRIQDLRLILSATLVLIVIAVVLDLAMGYFEKSMQRNHAMGRRILSSCAVLLAAVVLVLPFGRAQAADSNTLVVYDGDYSETQLMHHMLKILVEAKTPLKVQIKDQMSQVNSFKTLSQPGSDADLMISYDGTLLTTFLHLDPSDVPEGTSLYDFANEKAQAAHQLHLLGKLGFDNTYAIAVPQALAEQYQLNTVSDLVAAAPKLRFGAEHEFFTEEGSMKYKPFVDFYGLKFKDTVSVDVSLKYAAIENNSFDVTEVFATDGLNRKARLKVLEDDRSFFPEYNGAFLVKDGLFERFSQTAPNLREVLASLEGQIANEDMVEMTYRVDVQGESVDAVARDFLQSRGLI